MTNAPDPTPETPADAAGRPGLLSGERAGFAALAVSVVALIAAVAPYATGTDFNGRVRAYLVQHPEVLQEASVALQARAEQQESVDAVTRAAETTRLARATPALLAVDATDPAFGPADAKVTVMEFFDFRCPGCKATAPEVLRLMQAHPDVRFVFMDWPILDRGSDDVSHYAARAAQAAHRQGKYLPVFRDLMAEPGLTVEAVDRILEANHVDAPEAAMRSPETARHLADISTSATTLKLYGTPTFFVNGQAMASIRPQDLDAAIRKAKEG